VHLSRVDRWMLSNQYRVLELLDKKNADSHRHTQDALNSGYELCYDWLCDHVYAEKNTLSAEQCTYVLDVMSMFEALQTAYDSLEDSSGIEPTCVVFPGFDGNYETSYMGFARFFCDWQDAFHHLRKAATGLNSHRPTTDTYLRMLAAWNDSDTKHKLTKDDIGRILEAANQSSDR
jgi:uncharacterized protein